jgi:subtilisin-like proprotein convertase family protein
VELIVNVKHKKRGDLRFTIQSPSGFQATALPRKPDDNADFTDYMFTSPRFWGENGQGTWKIFVTDTVGNGVGGSLVDAKLKIYGTSAQ